MRPRGAVAKFISTVLIILIGGAVMAKGKQVEIDRKIANWLSSGEFHSEIDAALTNIVRCSELARTEADTATVFENEIYSMIRSRLGIAIDISKETPVKGVVHSFGTLASRHSGRGRIDAVINSLVVEYKHCSKLTKSNETQRQQAIAQVEDYLIALYRDDGIKRSAVLTDGVGIAYFSFSGERVRHTHLRMIGVDDIETLVRAILVSRTKKFEPRNIARDFSVSAASKSDSRQLAKAFYATLTDACTDKTAMLYEEWKGLMHLSVEDSGKSADIEKRRRDLSAIFCADISDAEAEYKALFALQTVYSVIVKLIACRVVDNLNYNEDAKSYCDLIGLTSTKLQRFLQMMEDGYSYSNMGVRNFLEGDFFSWYADESQWSKPFFDVISRIVNEIDGYSAFSLNVQYEPVDVFKDLYMGIIPQSVRHSMGEYFTPEWLADCVVEKSLELVPEKNDWKAVDPCCGSGIFIMALIKRVVGDVMIADLSKSDRQRLVENVLSRVYGVDINPLSVLSARVSYYLALHRLGGVSDVEIPVYLGDSAVIPMSKCVDQIECYAYSVNNLKCRSFDIVLPKRFVQREDFGKVMSRLQALVKAESANALYQVFYEKLDEKERCSESLCRYIRELSERLVELHKQRWDGIWIRIAMNFMMIARMESFDLIVGNPPWVKWEHLPEAYTRKIKEFCDVRHIFCNDGGVYGGAQLNLCALIANVTASNWLKKDGVLAFLMPDSIMSQNSYEEFRNFYLDGNKESRLYLQMIDRWLPPLRPFKVGNKSVTQDFNTYYYSSNTVDYAHGVPVREIGKRDRVSDDEVNTCSDFESASAYLEVGEGRVRQLARNSTAFTYDSKRHDFDCIIGRSDYLYRTGVESTPFEVFKMVAVGPSNLEGHYRFKNKILKTSRYKVTDIPDAGWDFTTTYLYPMLEGPNVKPFTYACGDNYHIVPYSETDTTSPVPIEKMLVRDMELATYFSGHRNILDMQSEKSKLMHRGGAFYALSKIGPYTFAPNMVAVRDNTYFCSTVVNDTVTAWGEKKKTICVKHTIIISQDCDGRFISEDEAHYINGVLNSTIVHDYIHSTFKTNGFSLNKSKLFLPRYQPNNKLFTNIAALSRKATTIEAFRQEAAKKLTVAYVELCKALNE